MANVFSLFTAVFFQVAVPIFFFVVGMIPLELVLVVPLALLALARLANWSDVRVFCCVLVPVSTMASTTKYSRRRITSVYVDLMCDWLQVIWVNADSLSAQVIKFFSFWNRALEYFIGNSVGWPGLTLKTDLSIAVGPDRCSPLPTASKAIDGHVRYQAVTDSKFHTNNYNAWGSRTQRFLQQLGLDRVDLT